MAVTESTYYDSDGVFVREIDISYDGQDQNVALFSSTDAVVESWVEVPTGLALDMVGPDSEVPASDLWGLMEYQLNNVLGAENLAVAESVIQDEASGNPGLNYALRTTLDGSGQGGVTGTYAFGGDGTGDGVASAIIVHGATLENQQDVELNGIDLAAITGEARVMDATGFNTLIGGDYGQILRAGDGNDEVHGNGGGDRINGMGGNDLLWGNDGADTFVFASDTDFDTIMDFSSEDMIAVRSDIAGTGIASASDVLARLATDASGDAYIDLGAETRISLDGLGTGDIDGSQIMVL